ncbi:FtsX-like permease family protein [Streptomyces sp. XM4193]|uniref:FtsX-like permease family protein n=1 Tax=Streptomyces sp. XM4193 TaxID=2929782 RepID=UPI001FF79204|nr:FtsX-like permease family protein [Streptomyces sp. XM4193]MCK1798193.1 FtsX-like permease family protein [Streptomyces sp. XM4193]
MRATLRWAHADLRTHRGEALFSVLATAGIITALLLATALFSYAANPWQRVFTQSTGAHVWMHTGTHTDAEELDRLTGMDGITAVAGPYRTLRVNAKLRGRAAVELRGVTAEPPRTARPLLTEGRWLTDSSRDGVVLQSSLADALWAETGDTLTLGGQGRTARTLTVVGIADTAEPRYQEGERPGLGWVLPATLDRVATDTDQRGQVVGLRLADPGDTNFAVQRAVTLLGADGVTQVSHWQQARNDAQSDDRLLGTLLAVFGVGALLAASVAVAGAISGRVRGQLRDISILKAIGFTPGQVVRIFLVQHVAFALLGAVLGVAALQLFGAALPGRLGDVVEVWRELPGHTAAMVLVPGAAVLFIAAATSLAAWRAGRVPPVPAARAAVPPAVRMSRVARTALGMRLPPALVLGWRAAFHHRGRSFATLARLTLPLLLITAALSAWSTIDRVETRPSELLATALTARATDDLGERAAAAMLADDPDVLAVHPGAQVAALAPGQTSTLTLRGLGTDREPYPFRVAEGRAPDGPDEAVAGQGLLDLLDLGVGDWVRLTVEGNPQVLHVVGRTVEPERGGRVIATSLDTLRERDPTVVADSHHLQLRDGARPSEVSERLADGSDNRLELREAGAPVEGMQSMRGVLLGLIGVLALIGLTELLTAVATRIKERERDLLAWKAIGLTPRQVTAVILSAVGLTALAAALAGTALGTVVGQWLIDMQGRTSGIGAGLAVGPPLWMLAAVVSSVVGGALLAALPPAVRVGRRRLADTLSAVA